MKIFITGATGFIGKHILDQFQNKKHSILASALEYEKINNNNQNIQWLYGNLHDIESLKSKIISFNPDIVIHLAWFGIPDYSENISIYNLNVSIKLLDIILEETNCKKIIVSGSCYEYGSVYGIANEQDNIKINSYFSWAKHSLFNYLYLKCSQREVQLIWFRFFYVFGTGQRQGSLLPTIINCIKKGEQLCLNNPFNKNDFIYVKDVALAVEMVVNAEKTIESGIYNLGTGSSTSVVEICKIVELLLTDKTSFSSLVKETESKENTDFWADISKIRNTLKWRPTFSIKEGIRDIIEKENL